MAAGKNPVILGMHWNQWETEVDTGGEAVEHAGENFAGVFGGLRRAVGIPLSHLAVLSPGYRLTTIRREWRR